MPAGTKDLPYYCERCGKHYAWKHVPADCENIARKPKAMVRGETWIEECMRLQRER